MTKREKMKKKVLVTGANGFIGKHFRLFMITLGIDCYYVEKETSDADLKRFCLDCDAVLHLAGVMRPQNVSEFYAVGNDLTDRMLTYLKANKKKPLIVFASSAQAILDNDYGNSKRIIEKKLTSYSLEFGNEVFIYRLTNVFGKWCRPNYNSVVSTFCNNIANNLPIIISNENTIVNFIYIDDVVKEFANTILNEKTKEKQDFYTVEPVYPVSIGQLANVLYRFKNEMDNCSIPSLTNDFEKKLFPMFLSFIPIGNLVQKTIFNKINHHTFFNVYESKELGSLSLKKIKPKESEPIRFYSSKVERLLILKGIVQIVISEFGKDSNKFTLKGSELTIFSVPPGYYYSLHNISEETAILFSWTNNLVESDDIFYLSNKKK